MMKGTVVEGLVAGLTGAAVMTLGEKIEQRFTGRPDSKVPGRTLQRLLRVCEVSPRWGRVLNVAMHAGQGALMGVLRAAMAHAGLRGPWASAMFTAVRLTNDQLLENATGVGAPPWTWPRDELAADVLHKTVYGMATGVVADALAARSGPGPGRRHAAVQPGRHHDVGPVGTGWFPSRDPDRQGEVGARGRS
ncbi:hypothetical protein [Microbispora corallina]|nr:hypothetical protein [Microbispora corallina]